MGPNNCLPADSDMDHFNHLLGFKYQSTLLPAFKPMTSVGLLGGLTSF